MKMNSNFILEIKIPVFTEMTNKTQTISQPQNKN